MEEETEGKPQKGAEEEEDDEELKWSCPISFVLLTDPVVAEDGFTYSREALQQHIEYSAERKWGTQASLLSVSALLGMGPWSHHLGRPSGVICKEACHLTHSLAFVTSLDRRPPSAVASDGVAHGVVLRAQPGAEVPGAGVHRGQAAEWGGQERL